MIYWELKYQILKRQIIIFGGNAHYVFDFVGFKYLIYLKHILIITINIGMDPFVVDGDNQISSVLMGMFFTPSQYDKLLNKSISSVEGMYIQELIKKGYVENIRNSRSISKKESINLKLIMMKNGWSSLRDWNNRHSCKEIYTFLLNMLEAPLIKMLHHTNIVSDSDMSEHTPDLSLSLSEDSHDSVRSTISIIESNCFIKINIKHNGPYNIRKIVEYWIKSNKKSIQEIPEFFAVYLNRITDNDVIIPPKIKMDKTKWKIHAVVCEGKESYTLLNYNDDWYICNTNHTPCVTKVRMDDKELIEKLKKESVIIMFSL